MQIQIISNRSVSVSDEFGVWIRSEVERFMDHYANRISRIELHFDDHDGPARNGFNSLTCTTEARIENRPAIAIQGSGGTPEAALDAALEKLQKVVAKTFDKADDKSGHTPFGGTPFKTMSEPSDLPVSAP